MDRVLVRWVLESRTEQARMSFHLTKKGAQEAASKREFEAAALANLARRGHPLVPHSSGHRFRRFSVRRQFFVLWEAYESTR